MPSGEPPAPLHAAYEVCASARRMVKYPPYTCGSGGSRDAFRFSPCVGATQVATLFASCRSGGSRDALEMMQLKLRIFSALEPRSLSIARCADCDANGVADQNSGVEPAISRLRVAERKPDPSNQHHAHVWNYMPLIEAVNVHVFNHRIDCWRLSLNFCENL